MSKKIKPAYHISGQSHVTGYSRFIGDGVKHQGILVAKMVVSTKAHAKLLEVDCEKAKKIAGVRAVLTYLDIPGENQVGHPVPDQPLLAETEVNFIGEPIALVVAESEKAATKALAAIDIKYEALPAIFSIEEAVGRKNFLGPCPKLETGDVEQAFATCDFVLEDMVGTPAQEHVYLETQRCIAVPGAEHEIILYPASQSANAVQEIAAQILGWKRKDITVDISRLGGAFGGKEGGITNAIAALTALACYHCNSSVELKLKRYEDQAWSGKRHPFSAKYKVGFNKDGKIIAYKAALYANGGAYTDLTLSVLERAVLSADNAYYIPNALIEGYPCRTNLLPNTAFRGFGGPQGIFIMESVIERVAQHLQMDPILIREVNVYQSGQKTHYGQIVSEACGEDMLKRLKTLSQYQQLKKDTELFNKNNSLVKRGLGVLLSKFGIAFTMSFINQASALIWLYGDGSVSLSHGAVEMGQQVHTKVAQIVAHTLGISLDSIRAESVNTKRIANASPTAASTATDLNGNAALKAAQELKSRLIPVAIRFLKKDHNVDSTVEDIIFLDNKIYDKSHPDQFITFKELVSHAYVMQVDLGAHGFYKADKLFYDRNTGKGEPFSYFVNGACLAQVEIDVLTGKTNVLKVFIVHEAATSINKEIDIGQVTGAFCQGYGWCTMEELQLNSEGRYLADTMATYKIPGIRDLPDVFEIEMVELKREKASVFGSKAVGEPPYTYGGATYFAIKNAILSLADNDKDVQLKMPATPEAIVMAIEEL
ncbi:MAG: molybdopterin-dependent oxidoreductase [Gammaproteobacteria bacterium]|nr:molybdopterin-dependent oxidoreductase [Gammaproteobacteria bacterium]